MGFVNPFVPKGRETDMGDAMEKSQIAYRTLFLCLSHSVSRI
jgi:hypothetical protein